jgi:hypothetical protein
LAFRFFWKENREKKKKEEGINENDEVKKTTNLMWRRAVASVAIPLSAVQKPKNK